MYKCLYVKTPFYLITKDNINFKKIVKVTVAKSLHNYALMCKFFICGKHNACKLLAFVTLAIFFKCIYIYISSFVIK